MTYSTRKSVPRFNTVRYDIDLLNIQVSLSHSKISQENIFQIMFPSYSENNVKFRLAHKRKAVEIQLESNFVSFIQWNHNFSNDLMGEIDLIMHTHTHTLGQIYKHTHTYTRTDIQTHTHTHKYTHEHTY